MSVVSAGVGGVARGDGVVCCVVLVGVVVFCVSISIMRFCVSSWD